MVNFPTVFEDSVKENLMENRPIDSRLTIYLSAPLTKSNSSRAYVSPPIGGKRYSSWRVAAESLSNKLDLIAWADPDDRIKFAAHLAASKVKEIMATNEVLLCGFSSREKQVIEYALEGEDLPSGLSPWFKD